MTQGQGQGQEVLATISKSEIVELAAVDSEFFCRVFFPKTVRQKSPDFHKDIWTKLESNARQVNILVFRGGAKTSICRMFTAKRIAYRISRTILYLGKSEGHAIRSVSWLKKQIEQNTRFAQTFGLRPGSKWQDTECEILAGEGANEVSIWIMAMGIEGSVRGVNRDDFRPDLVVLDDVLDDTNAHTLEQRKKIEELIYGAVLESLAPKSECPSAMICALNTPQHKEDFAVKALKDPSWVSAVYGCWTRETQGLPVGEQESIWPDRWPSSELRAEKHSAMSRNMLSTFLREKECKLTSAETTSFKIPWLKKYTVAPEGINCVYAIDPVPPPSEAAISKGLHKNDYEAHVIWGARGDDRFLLDYRLMRGHEPTWTIATFFAMHRRWHPYRTIVESVAYQRTLAWLLRQAMDQQRVWHPIEEYVDKRSKFTRIVSTLNEIAAMGNMYVRDDHGDYLSQFALYPDTDHDDLLDASAMALSALAGKFFNEEGEIVDRSEDARLYERLERTYMGAP